jgi:hypothetical protein
LNLQRGLVVDTALGSAIQMLMGLAGGGILAVIYFSELRLKFRPFAEVLSGTSKSA